MNTEEDSLIIFERAAMMLAEADTVQKCKAGKDLCATAERYAKAQKLSEESILHARSYALEFERKLGEMLKEKTNPSREHGGLGYKKIGGESGSLPNSTPTLKELGVTKDESKTAQAVADLPDETFQAVKAGTISKKAAIKQNKMAGSSGNGDRPKSTKKPRRAPKRDDRTDEVMPLSDQGLTLDEIASQTGVPTRQARHIIDEEMIRRGAKAETPIIDPVTLSMSAQQKLDAALRQQKERQNREFEAMKYQWLKEKTDSFLERLQPQLRAEQETAKRIMMRRDGFMTKKIYRLIISCLHPDWVTDPTQKERYAAAFSEFTKLEKFLLSEKDSPTVFADIPRTRAEWDERKRKVSEERKARRAASKAGIQPK